MNLYNNGFSGGFVAMFLLPIIEAFRNIKNKFFERLKRSGEEW
jgi:hypothetical protein